MSKAEALQLVGDCVHHWVLESPKGELTPGRCKKCSKEKEFTGETSYRIGRGSSRLTGCGRRYRLRLLRKGPDGPLDCIGRAGHGYKS